MSYKRQILLISTNSDEAGAPLHVETLVNCLMDEVDFTLIFGEDGPVFRRLKSRGVKAHILSGMRSNINPLMDLFLLFRLLFIIHKAQPDLIHCHSSKAGLLGRLAGRFYSTPVVFTIHGWSWTALNGRSAGLALFLERFLSKLKETFFIYVCKDMEVLGGDKISIPGSRGRVIYNGMRDVGPASPDLSCINIIMPARVSRQKDHETLVRAFDLLPVGSTKLILCGAGTDSDEFIEKLSLWSPRRHLEIECLGQRSDVPDLLRRSHIMVLSSNWEALPLSIIEAMSAQLSVVASNVGGVSELIENGKTGILVSPGDVNEMFEAIQSLLAFDVRSSFGLAARKRYKEFFTEKAMASATLEYYKYLTSK